MGSPEVADPRRTLGQVQEGCLVGQVVVRDEIHCSRNISRTVRTPCADEDALHRARISVVERPDTRRIWDANAAAWVELSRAGLDIYRDLVNTPGFFALLPDVEGRFGLDLGCGEGHNTRLLAATGANIVALDVSEPFIAAAASESRVGIWYVIGDGAVLPFADGSFDFITAFMSLMDVADPENTLRETARVLKPEGFVQFSVVQPATGTPIRRWVEDDSGQRNALAIGGYFYEGPLTETWIFGAASGAAPTPSPVRDHLCPPYPHRMVQRASRCRAHNRSDRRTPR